MTHLSEFDLTCRQERSANAEKGLGRAKGLRGREGKEQAKYRLHPFINSTTCRGPRSHPKEPTMLCTASLASTLPGAGRIHAGVSSDLAETSGRTILGDKTTGGVLRARHLPTTAVWPAHSVPSRNTRLLGYWYGHAMKVQRLCYMGIYFSYLSLLCSGSTSYSATCRGPATCRSCPAQWPPRFPSVTHPDQAQQAAC